MRRTIKSHCVGKSSGPLGTHWQGGGNPIGNVAPILMGWAGGQTDPNPVPNDSLCGFSKSFPILIATFWTYFFSDEIHFGFVSSMHWWIVILNPKYLFQIQILKIRHAENWIIISVKAWLARLRSNSRHCSYRTEPRVITWSCSDGGHISRYKSDDTEKRYVICDVWECLHIFIA